jgi:hypothetical protein
MTGAVKEAGDKISQGQEMAQVAIVIIKIKALRLLRRSGTGGSAFRVAHQNRRFRKRRLGASAPSIARRAA